MRMERFPGKRQAVPAQLRSRAMPYTFPAPVGGWVTNESLVRSKPMTAQRLENFFPTSTGMRLRGGSDKHATIGTVAVQSFLTYNAGGTQKLFAADATKIFDITTP